ncbi:hypothetical protein NliqN6_6307 [Naganishia liquefaciens]|uniref:Uncharacterized protein n=1 Tax=Naganishia liquefaciens TaxID=104408 RepID=A0A8H3YHE8_9TREE|nr:hypothetical protein NliqN6_6307 [Naganishia liquefaciens]
MGSPMHSFLFSPPTSPTAIQASHSPLLEPVETFNALNRLLSPRVGPSTTFQPGPELGSRKVSSTISHQDCDDGQGGFPSTRSYPSRSVSPINLAPLPAHGELPPFPSSSSSSYQPRSSSAPVLSRHNSFSASAPPNVPTDFTLPPPATHRDALATLRKTWLSFPRPKTVVRLILAALLLFGSISLVLRSTSPLLSSTTRESHDKLPMSVIQQQLIDIERISVVGGKKVRVTGQWGAPRTLTYADEQQAMAPSRAYRPVNSPIPLTASQELLALQSYLLAGPTNSLLPTIDTSRPLDPMSLVGFHANDAHGWTELRAEVEPVVIWSTGPTWTDPVHELLALYALTPGPHTLSLDSRPDQAAIKATLSRLVTGRSADSPAPLITIGGRPIDGYAPLLKLHVEGKLHGMLERAGAVVDGKRAQEELDRARAARLQKRVKQARIVFRDEDDEA